MKKNSAGDYTYKGFQIRKSGKIWQVIIDITTGQPSDTAGTLRECKGIIDSWDI